MSPPARVVLQNEPIDRDREWRAAALAWPVQRERFAGAGNAGVIDPDASSRDLPRTVVAMHGFAGVHEAKRLAAEGERLPLTQ